MSNFISVKYNPYRLCTSIECNGNPITSDSRLYKFLENKRMQEWIVNFPELLRDELNSLEFELTFTGLKLDYDDFKESFEQAKEKGIIKDFTCNYKESRSVDSVCEGIKKLFNDLQNGPLDEFRSEELLKKFKEVDEDKFPVSVVATMSSGKSTLINALLQKKLMPYKNESCTGVITEVLDNDKDNFSALVFDKNGELIEKVPSLSYEKMEELNSSKNVNRIFATGNIPFIDSNDIALKIIDTPGPNSALNKEHQKITYTSIGDTNNLILYVLNAAQLATTDDEILLKSVAEKMKAGGKEVRDRFLFVLNRMDDYDPETESIENAIEHAKEHLKENGINDPQLFPCSAFTAINTRLYLKNIDISKLSYMDAANLPQSARDTLPKITKFNSYEKMHLEKYSSLSPSEKKDLEYKLKLAEERNDLIGQALIHSGINSIEKAITAYVKKYAKTKKIRDLVETFYSILESQQTIAKAKEKIATNKEAAKKISEAAQIIKEKISNGEEAQKFKDRCLSLDPIPSVDKKIDVLKDKTIKKVSSIFEDYGETIFNRNEALGLIRSFKKTATAVTAELSAEIDRVIDNELQNAGRKLLEEYAEKITEIDESINTNLDFNTMDLIKAEISGLNENIKKWDSNNNYDNETITELADVKKETKTYYIKTGERKEKRWVGKEKISVGTRRVKSGSHKEERSEYIDNPEREVFFGFFKFWKPSKVKRTIQVDVDDYKDEEIFEERDIFKTVTEDVMEKRTETIEKFSITVSELQMKYLATIRQQIDKSIDEIRKLTVTQVKEIKEAFETSFEQLDNAINAKYAELTKFDQDKENLEQEIQENSKIIEWLDENLKEIDELLTV